MKSEKVKVDLSNVRNDPPVIYQKPDHGAPMSGQFNFMPRMMPQLRHCVRSLLWNSTSKYLKLSLVETAGFDVYRWLQLIVEHHEDFQINSFSEQESSQAKLDFLDTQGRLVAKAYFRNLSVIEQSCALYQQDASPQEAFDQKLTYSVTMAYQTVRVCFARGDGVSDQEEADREWQEIKAP